MTVAVSNSYQSIIYVPIQCGTSVQRLILLAYAMTRKVVRQCPWILDDGVFHFIHFDPWRERLLDRRDARIHAARRRSLRFSLCLVFDL